MQPLNLNDSQGAQPPPASPDAPPSLLNPEPPRKRRTWLAVLLVIVGLVGAVYGWNYVALQSPMSDVLSGDPRNKGVSVSVHYENYIDPSTLIYDLRDVSGPNSKMDVFRVFLQFADKLKDRKFDTVILSFRGKQKFKMSGAYFQQLGREYGYQNPVHTLNHLPENLKDMDGTPAFGTWTGGWLGVMQKQMEDFNEFHDKWYLNDMR